MWQINIEKYLCHVKKCLFYLIQAIYFLFFKSELASRTVLSICICSSFDFPSFKSSKINEISSGEKRIPFLFAFVIRARRIGARSLPDFPFVFAAAVRISSSFAGSIFCNIGCSIQLFIYNSLQRIMFQRYRKFLHICVCIGSRNIG